MAGGAAHGQAAAVNEADYSPILQMAPLYLSAQDATGATTPAPQDDSKKLRLAISPFIWLTGFDGTLGIAGVDAKINASFWDVLDESESIFALTGALDIEYERLVFQINAMWSTAELNQSKAITQNIKIDADIDQDASWTEIFGGYRFIQKPLGDGSDPSKQFALDGLVGMRLTIIDVDAHMTAKAMVTLPNGTVLEADRKTSIHQTEAWVEPFIGARIMMSLDEHWIVSLKGDVGGFGVDGSDFSWSALGLVGYRWINDGWDIGLYGGYRAIGQDYSDHEFTWDIITYGPVVGAAFVFHF